MFRSLSAERLEGNLEAFREHVETSRDPYPAIGRFVGIAREAVVDWAVDADEVSQLNSMLEGELGRERARVSRSFRLHTPFEAAGDQVEAIERLVRGVDDGLAAQTLLGVTGSGKTFTMAQVINRTNRPTLILSHNKTLAAQLYQEFRAFFPENAVEYFVSYYDYYQPEAYVVSSDTYIEKETSINEEIDRMRLSATRSLFERRDVIIVASVSCIYGLGSPEAYFGMLQLFEVGTTQPLDDVLRQLAKMQYERTNLDLAPATFRLRGDLLEIYPPYDSVASRISFWGDEVESIHRIDPVTGKALEALDRLPIYPRTHYVTPKEQMAAAIVSIRDELDERLAELKAAERLLEAQRLSQRTLFDLEMLTELGYCSGIENYTRHLTGREPGEPPPTLLDYFPTTSCSSSTRATLRCRRSAACTTATVRAS